VRAALGGGSLTTVRAPAPPRADTPAPLTSTPQTRQVYVCGGTRVLRPHALQELEALATLGRPLLVLTDPDERGRQLRGHLDAALAPLLPRERLLHAFVPEASAMAGAAGPVHDAGNRGIEHAVPEVLVASIRAAAPAYADGRAEWDLPRLQALRLARPFDGGKAAQGERQLGVGVGGGGGGGDAASGGASGGGGSGGGGSGGGSPAADDEPRLRRRRLCALLGLGRCSGSQLAAALNKYFSEERVARALAALEGGGGGRGLDGGGRGER
jgi:uncharacterized membrane protein YgcG